MTKHRNDLQSYWSVYREVQEQIFESLAGSHGPRLFGGPAGYEAEWFQCVYCRQRFETLAEIKTHYTRNQVGADSTLIPRSRRGSSSEKAWKKNVAAVSAPTIKAVL